MVLCGTGWHVAVLRAELDELNLACLRSVTLIWVIRSKILSLCLAVMVQREVLVSQLSSCSPIYLGTLFFLDGKVLVDHFLRQKSLLWQGALCRKPALGAAQIWGYRKNLSAFRFFSLLTYGVLLFSTHQQELEQEILNIFFVGYIDLTCACV